MKKNRNPSADHSIQNKQTLNTDDIVDLTSEDAGTIESGLEELNIADNPRAIKKTVPKKEKPKLRLKCKSHKSLFYVAVGKAKKIWELMRRDDCTKEKKVTLLKDLFKYSKPHLQTMVYLHDNICIVQCLLKLGTPEIRSQVINELIKHVPKIIFCKYASSCVQNMLKQGDAEQRKIIINSLKGKVNKYILHTNSAKIMDLIYTTYATPEQQNAMMHELYGASSVLYDSPNVLSLTDILENSPDSKDIILAKTTKNIRKFVLKQDTSMQTTLVHNLIREYIVYTGLENCYELITFLKELPIELFYSTKSGCYIAMSMINCANSKEHKSLLKKIKATAATRDLATSDYGYLILFGLFDGVDDTALIKRIIYPEILNNLEEIVSNENGRRLMFSFGVFRRLPESNGIGERARRLSVSIFNSLVRCIQKNPMCWISNLEMAMVLKDIIHECRGAKLKKLMTTVINFIFDPKNKLKDRFLGKVPVYEHSGVLKAIELLMTGDFLLTLNNEITFSEVLSSIITTDIIKSWVKRKDACYLLAKMMDSEVELVVENIKSLFSPTIMDLLKEQQFDLAQRLVLDLS
ncbi:pumilio homolog 3-like [Aphis gossypii]|uniref:Uncharacterized protein n=1 Tax=Aphis gossypii TaxID=80765 RepID=A0A9P0NQ19_APHGO|nr:pumilio homolog 3-like [Aphis gossypii]XP_050061643.1 pumilio homolog 3-like [Aphis gossypii]XP_050061644.1 pumilio homolog 3-like [Aphis gossypii]XP_050061645.1 pumilio homolog 3-like [Aphis gossypii]XP_050061646.1 pumilio homolog 3-like [Aphis gossypii]XP_050061647.1 pumilio homolog 3-like [Aphis gossypii]CAH1732042.1 unnamed protein product [Aphis gossypii]CAH1732045.1 unnamed protein product [Aphis gossypii]